MVIAVLAVVSGQTAHANPNGYTQDELHALQQREKQIPANGSPPQPMGYSENELRALQQREIQVQSTVNAPLLDLDTLWQKARAFETETLAMQQDALSPILKQAEISNNPNSTPPKGG